jgi:thiosulfate/3-mercaptopyruvate sulfurtransferase
VAANTLISVTELQQSIDRALAEGNQLIIIDCRFSLLDPDVGAAEYLAGHIPGAQYAHLNQHLSGPLVPGTTGRHPLPKRPEFIKTIQHFGINNHQMVVAYDGGNGAYGARLWWLLRWLGHDQVVVLDGGFKAWQDAGLDTSSAVPDAATSQFKDADSLVLSIEAEAILTANTAVTDAREPARYRGEVEPIDPVAGHIPGARNLPFTENLNADGSFKSTEALKARFLKAELSQQSPTICYCGSGVTACHNILALVHAGFPEPILYPGSWSEWVTDPKRPVAIGFAGDGKLA